MNHLASVDLLLITQNDFDNILRVSLKKNWDILSDALVHFNYFKLWDEDTVRECCILSKLKDFEPNEVNNLQCTRSFYKIRVLIARHSQGSLRKLTQIIIKRTENTNELILKVLLGDGRGLVNYVHFILSGKCRLIEHMLVRERSSYHGTRYELHDPEDGPQEQPRRMSKEIAKSDKLESNQLDKSLPVRIKKRNYLLSLFSYTLFL